MLLLAATLPVCAAAIYVMWPSFSGNSALPYVPGIALAFALALSRLWDASPIRRALVVVAASVVIGYGALFAVNGRREYTASRLLDVDVATFVSAIPSPQLVVAVDDPQLSGEFGRGVVLYAKAMHGRAPASASDVDCADAERLVAELSPDVTLLRPPDACKNANLGTPTTSLTRTTVVRDWKTLRPGPWEAAAASWHRRGTR